MNLEFGCLLTKMHYLDKQLLGQLIADMQAKGQGPPIPLGGKNIALAYLKDTDVKDGAPTFVGAVIYDTKARWWADDQQVFRALWVERPLVPIRLFPEVEIYASFIIEGNLPEPTDHWRSKIRQGLVDEMKHQVSLLAEEPITRK